ncbi:hypothetical protein [Microcoleus anatoxicus]|uniref:hypothetical protein n=1 Tax=Microcoleus anatoxicus TaxID=2705319 RepID=UPI0030C9C57D
MTKSSVYLLFKSPIALTTKSAIALTRELSELSQVQFNQQPPNHLKMLARVVNCPSRFRSALLK